MITFSRVVAIRAINTTTNYKIVRLSLKFNPRKCKENYISLYINMDDGTSFKYLIERCIVSTIYSLATFPRVIPLCNTNTIAIWTIVWLSLGLHPQNYKVNPMSLYMYMDNGTTSKILFVGVMTI